MDAKKQRLAMQRVATKAVKTPEGEETVRNMMPLEQGPLTVHASQHLEPDQVRDAIVERKWTRSLKKRAPNGAKD